MMWNRWSVFEATKAHSAVRHNMRGGAGCGTEDGRREILDCVAVYMYVYYCVCLLSVFLFKCYGGITHSTVQFLSCTALWFANK